MTHPAHTLGRARLAPPPVARRERPGRSPAVLREEVPAEPGSRAADVLAFVAEHRARLLRVGLHLVVAALPLLAISAHVFGLAPMNVTAGLVVVPLTLVALVLGVFSPAGEERLVLAGATWGVLATLVYDAVRLDTVYMLGWWGDFIPRVGTWIVDVDADRSVLGAVVGYVWRYVGDGGGIGVAFFLLVAATGLRRWGERATVMASVVFAVFPVWTGLVATVALAPRGQQQMFALTPATVALSLLGHLVFGLVLGLGCARCRRLEEYWPWTPLLDLRRSGTGTPRTGVWPAAVPSAPDDGWGPPALVVPPETAAERTEIRVERPRPLARATRRRAIGDGSGPIPLPEGRREPRVPVSGPVRVRASRPVGDPRSGALTSRPPSGPVPIPDPRSGPVRLPVPPATGPWSRAAPPRAADPWLGDRRRGATSSANPHPGVPARG
ncbi:hypothetical protein GCM10023200_38460 [Actinomycetospora chlora]|uniref:Uncharacterized protein n=1 Tax=Actinomycetospora chlora TaxID=663608 RepID=A0ABP9BRW7_9PSEU